jgi:hypothetical protein
MKTKIDTSTKKIHMQLSELRKITHKALISLSLATKAKRGQHNFKMEGNKEID